MWKDIKNKTENLIKYSNQKHKTVVEKIDPSA